MPEIPFPPQPPHALYAFCIGDEVKYIGKTRRGLLGRLNGYVHAPQGDRRTNGRIRDCIRRHIQTNRDASKVDILIFTPDPYIHWGEFVLNIPAGLEDILIAELQPQWNGGHVDTDIVDENPQQVEPPVAVPVENIGNEGFAGQCRRFILAQIAQAGQEGLPYIDITSGTIHDELNYANRFPTCCDAMKSVFSPGDSILHLPENRFINTQGVTFDEQRNNQPYRGSTLQVRFLTETPRDHTV